MIKQIKFFGKDKTGYSCELKKPMKTAEDVKEFNKDMVEVKGELR